MSDTSNNLPCYKYLIRRIKDQDELLIFAKNYFVVSNSLGIPEDDAIMGYLAFRSSLTSNNSHLQLTMYKGATLSAKDFRSALLNDVEIFPQDKCSLYASSIDPIIVAPIKKRGAPTICGMCDCVKGTKKYKNKFHREEIALLRYICESHDNLQALRKMLGDLKPSSLFKTAVDLAEEVDSDYPVLIPLNMLLCRMLENIGKDFYISAPDLSDEDLLVIRFENKSASLCNNARKYDSDQAQRFQDQTGLAFQNIFKFEYDMLAQSIASSGIPSAEYVSQIINTILKENGTVKRKKNSGKQKENDAPAAPMFRLSDVVGELHNDVTESDHPDTVNKSDELDEVIAEDGTKLVFLKDDDFTDSISSDGVEDLPFSPSGGVLAEKLSEKYADQLDEPDEPIIDNADSQKSEDVFDEPEEPDVPDEPSSASIEEPDEPVPFNEIEEPDEPDDMTDGEVPSNMSDDMPFTDSTNEAERVTEQNSDVSSKTNDVADNDADTSDEQAEQVTDIAISGNTGVVIPGEDSALYLPTISNDILREHCTVYDEDEHGKLLGEAVKRSDVVPVEIYLSEAREYGLIILDRLHMTYYVTQSMSEPTIRFILGHQQITKVCWQPYFLYSQCRELDVGIRSVHSLFTSNAIFNPPMPYIPRANTLSAYLSVYRKSHKFRLRKTGITLLDEMQCYTPSYYMQMRTLSDSKALKANYLRDEVLGRSFMRRTMFNDNGCLFDIDKQKGQLHYNANTDISCKTSGVMLTYILEQDNLTTQSVFHLYMRALIMLADKGYIRKLPIQLMLMDSTHGIMQLFVGRSCYDLVKTNLQVFFNSYAIQHEAERFRLYVDAQVQDPPGTQRKLPTYNLLPTSLDDALDLYSTTDVVVPVANSHIIKPMLARKVAAPNESQRTSSFPPKIDE